MSTGSVHLDLAELIAEVNGEATDDRVWKHLAACPQCRAGAEHWGAVAGGVRHLVAAASAPAWLPSGALADAGKTPPSRRRRRFAAFAGLGVIGVAAGAVLAFGLTGVLGAAPARSTGTIRTTAFTLVEHTNGTATLTINPNVVLEPSTLQRDLRHDRIPAMVTTGRFCSSHPSPAGFTQVVTGQRSSPDTMTINPAAMPAGTELSFGYFQLSTGGQETAVALIDTNSYTCTRTAPAALSFKGDMVGQHIPGGPKAR